MILESIEITVIGMLLTMAFIGLMIGAMRLSSVLVGKMKPAQDTKLVAAIVATIKNKG